MVPWMPVALSHSRVVVVVLRATVVVVSACRSVEACLETTSWREGCPKVGSKAAGASACNAWRRCRCAGCCCGNPLQCCDCSLNGREALHESLAFQQVRLVLLVLREQTPQAGKLCA